MFQAPTVPQYYYSFTGKRVYFKQPRFLSIVILLQLSVCISSNVIVLQVSVCILSYSLNGPSDLKSSYLRL